MKTSKHFFTSDNCFRVHISEETLDEILSLSSAAGIKETGGILFGHYGDDHIDAYVVKASGPGRGSKHGLASFFRAVGQLQAWLDNLWYGGDGYYLGEWHFHPMSSPTPSGTDRKQLLEIAADEKTSCPEPILLIIGGDPKSDWSISVSVFTRSGVFYELQEEI